MNLPTNQTQTQRDAPPLTGAELQTLRESCHLTRDDLAILVNVQARTVKHWENGRATVPQDVASLLEKRNILINTIAINHATQVKTGTHPGMMSDGSGVALVTLYGNGLIFATAARLGLILQLTQPNESTAPPTRVYLVSLDEDLFTAWRNNNPTQKHTETALYIWAAQHRATLPR